MKKGVDSLMGQHRLSLYPAVQDVEFKSSPLDKLNLLLHFLWQVQVTKGVTPYVVTYLFRPDQEVSFKLWFLGFMSLLVGLSHGQDPDGPGTSALICIWLGKLVDATLSLLMERDLQRRE